MNVLYLLACLNFGETTPADTANPSRFDSASDSGSTSGAVLSVAVGVSAVFDPFHGGRAEVLVDFSAGALARVAVADDSGAEIAVLAEGLTDGESISWNGQDQDGQTVEPGAYTVLASAERDGEIVQQEAVTHVIAVGATSGRLTGDRLPLMWHAASGGYWTEAPEDDTFAIASLRENGRVTTVDEPWPDLNSPPASDAVSFNMPAAYPFDATPGLELVLDMELGDYTGDLALSVDGWDVVEGDMTDGGVVSLVKQSTLSDGPSVEEPELALRFVTGEGEVGVQQLPLRMYALLDAHTFEESGSAYGSWVAAIDPALRAIDGVEPTSDAVTGALVEFIFRDLGLRYDTTYGASAYVSYRQGSWTRAHFNFTAFLQRSNGAVINCTDAAAILGAYSNMLGADLDYMILNPSFELNYILAIGGSQFTNCPFGRGGCGFSYHAVTSPDGGGTIFDATLAIDGDGDPRNAPHTEQLVQGVTGTDYQTAIVKRGVPTYHSSSKGTIQ